MGIYDATINGTMVTAALVATITFAAMMSPPGGVISPPGTAGGSNPGENVGHTVTVSYGHEKEGKLFLTFLFLGFTFSLCSLLCASAVTEIEGPRRGQMWILTYNATSIFLTFAVLSTFIAFVVAAFVVYDDLNGTLVPLSAVTASLVIICAAWNILGPFSTVYKVICFWDPSYREVEWDRRVGCRRNKNYVECRNCRLDIFIQKHQPLFPTTCPHCQHENRNINDDNN